MHYTTVTVGLVEGHEKDGINDAIAQGLNELQEEVNGPVMLVNVVPVPLSSGLSLVIMAVPYRPVPVINGNPPVAPLSMQDVFERMKERR